MRTKQYKQHNKTSKSSPAFTIVELLVVIVIIGILASITIVSYTGVANRAKIASLQSDLTNNAKKLQMYYADHGSYPTAMTDNCPTAPATDSQYCLKANSDLEYTGGPTSFALKAIEGNLSYQVTEKGNPTVACPSGFIVVPGSTTYNTNDFCVMKYEAKQVGSTNVPESVPAGAPWVYITQSSAVANSQNVEHCDSCHLISEAEWLTIAQNVLSVPSNWRDNVVGIASSGSNYIYSGHNDNAPSNALNADPSGDDGYYDTGNNTSSGGNQRRTLTLTNGETIWDIAGNVYERTSGQTDGVTAQQPGVAGNNYSSYIEWNAVTTPSGVSPNPLPSYGTPLANNWDSTNGIGKLLSSTTSTSLIGFTRGGFWSDGSNAGILSLVLGYSPTDTYGIVGFRVASSR